jgi:hypothetical protein
MATTPPTAADIECWAREWPHANVGLLLELARILVVDVDSEEALGEATGYGLPPAWVATTGKGRHYYYKTPAHVIGKRTTKRGITKAIDILGGGYIVSVPSRHRTGKQYQWIIAPEVRPLTDAPAWAVEMLEQATVLADAATPVLPTILPISAADSLLVSERVKSLIRDGLSPRYPSRSEAVFAAIMALIAAGYDDVTIAGVLMDAANGISAKPRALGRRWIAREIARARAKSDVWVPA